MSQIIFTTHSQWHSVTVVIDIIITTHRSAADEITEDTELRIYITILKHL